MGERKVLNKYFPPDFDPAKLPRNKRPKTNDMKVRMMLPMSVRCKTCGTFMYKGTKFNTRKEDVVGETYLGIQIFRFYYRCTNCAAEFTMVTDPKNSDYVLEQGASRNYEPWRESDQQEAKAKAAREEEEMGNAMKALENRTLDSKREMDILAALDETRSLNARHNKVTYEEALEALKREAERQQVPLQDVDDDDLREYYQLRLSSKKAVSSDDSDQEPDQQHTVLRHKPAHKAPAAGAGEESSIAQPQEIVSIAPQGQAHAKEGKPVQATSKAPARQLVAKVVVKPRAQATQPGLQNSMAETAGSKQQQEPEGLLGLAGYGDGSSDSTVDC